MKTCKSKLALTIARMLLLASLFLILTAAAAAQARQFNITVTTILASHGKSGVDPRLRGQIKELQAAFRYASYRLINTTRQRLAVGQTGRASLPGGRVLAITPQGVAGNRGQLKLAVFKNGQPTFQTEIRLINRGRIIVGGPQHQQGVIIFIISNSF